MTADPEQHSNPETENPVVRNNLGADAVARNVIQTGAIHGGVHLHAAPAAEIPSDSPPIVVTTEIMPDTNYVRVRSPTEPDDDLVPVSGHAVRILVEAVGTRTVILRRLRPVVLSCSEPPERVLWPHRGVIKPRSFEVVLDDASPRIRPSNAGPDFPFSVSPSDPEAFDVTAHTRSHDVRWRLELDWTCAGQSGTTGVDLAGHPFRTLPSERP